MLGSAVFLVIAPGFIAGLAPFWISRWRMQDPFPGFALFRACGVMLIALGAAVVLESFARFALKGLGTPAPVFPPCHLVISGLYRYVRNPMYIAVVSVIVGQAALFGSLALLEYAGVIWLLFHVWVLIYEEPTLRTTFGPEYQSFCATVPRWIPRFAPMRIARS